MIAGIRLKVCGLTSLVDADIADQVGADYLGFNLYPKSPRYLALAQFAAMRPRLPDRRTVAVAVEPSPEELAAMAGAGFDFFQIHFRPGTATAAIAAWSKTVGRERLWLAPQLPPAEDVPAAWLELADTLLFDAFHQDKFGGTGRTSDWAKFARHREKWPKHRWILAGGLSPENIAEAVTASGASWVDVNSGVESAPGVKDQAKLTRLAAELRRSRAA